MSYIEDILYEALKFGIHSNVIDRVRLLKKKEPHSQLEDLYEEALKIEKEFKEKL